MTDLAGFATATVNAAARLHPDDPEAAEKVTEAWTDVGVLGDHADPEPAPGPGRAAARTVAISRSGGITGVPRTTKVDLDSDDGRAISGLLQQVDFASVTGGPQPDRSSKSCSTATGS